MGIRLDFGVSYFVAVDVADGLITHLNLDPVSAGCIAAISVIIALYIRLSDRDLASALSERLTTGYGSLRPLIESCSWAMSSRRPK